MNDVEPKYSYNYVSSLRTYVKMIIELRNADWIGISEIHIRIRLCIHIYEHAQNRDAHTQ